MDDIGFEQQDGRVTCRIKAATQRLGLGNPVVQVALIQRALQLLGRYASMSGPTKELEEIVLGEQLNHGKNPVLRWMASNVSIEQDAAGNIKASKAKSTERIDGIIASIMALGRVIANAEPVEIYASGKFSFI